MARVNRDDMLSNVICSTAPAWLCPCGIAGQAVHGVEGLRTNVAEGLRLRGRSMPRLSHAS
eukprot:scaffold7702_cov139-Isochrysis_galbana.AAC.1